MAGSGTLSLVMHLIIYWLINKWRAERMKYQIWKKLTVNIKCKYHMIILLIRRAESIRAGGYCNREKKLRHDMISRQFFVNDLSNLRAILVTILVAKAIPAKKPK